MMTVRLSILDKVKTKELKQRDQEMKPGKELLLNKKKILFKMIQKILMKTCTKRILMMMMKMIMNID